MTDRRRTAARAVVMATAIAVVLAFSRRIDTLSNGLRGQYFPNSDWSGEPATSRVDATPATAVLIDEGHQPAAGSFSISWTGWIIAPADDAYTFATTSDNGSSVYIDRDLVVDNVGTDGRRTQTGPTIRLARGPHAVFIKYFHNGGDAELEWLWQRGAGRFSPVPSWALRPRRIEFARFVADRAAEIAASLAVWTWAAAVAAAALFAFRPEIDGALSAADAARRELIAEGSWPPLVALVAGSAAMNVVGLWWGLPGGVWIGDELIPSTVVSGWPHYFSHGWSDKYPPLHFYVLTVAYLPIVALKEIAPIDPVVVSALFMIAGRLVSVLMAAGTIVFVFCLGRRTFGPRAGLFAAALMALSAPFVYYAKAANVDIPYLFWFALSLLFYLRVLEGGTRRDFAAWGITAALAVCTKDQAYGLYVLMPLPVIAELRREKRPLAAPLAVALIAAVLTFALIHNLAFNASGFAGHLRTILGPASQNYRGYDRSVAGEVGLLALTLKLFPLSLGWPVTITCLAGVVLAATSSATRRLTVWLLVPCASYYLTFVAVVLYNYDRFLLPVFAIVSLFGGLALDRMTRAPWPRAVRVGLATAVVVYTLLFSATVDVAMTVDSRYDAERWLAHHVKDEDIVATTSIATYMPRMSAFNTIEVDDAETLEDLRPRFVIVNADYTLTEPPHTPLGRALSLLRTGEAGYRLAITLRSSNPLQWLPGGHADLVGERRDPEVVSFLRNINPRIEIFERTPP